METIKGTIQSVSVQEGMGKTGKPYKRWVFVVDEKKYSTFDEKIGTAGFQVGDFISMDGERNGQYFNMKTMSKSDKTQASVPIQDRSQEIVDLLRQILGELKSLDVDRTIWTAVKPNEDKQE